MTHRSDETVGEWQARKRAQAQRFMRVDPSIRSESWMDYKTRFVLIHPQTGVLTIGQLERLDHQPRIDLTDEQIAQWLAGGATGWPRKPETL
jgi:hypothetical protein